MSEPLTNRQQSYVSRIIQGSLLRQLGAYWLANLLLLWHGMFLLNYFGVPNSLRNDEVPLTLWELYWRFCQANVHLVLCAVAIFPLFYWNALQLTHRIAGPLERFRRALERLQAGEKVKPLTLRRDDLLVEFQQTFNRYLVFLERKELSQNPSPESISPAPETKTQDSVQVLETTCPE